MSKIIDGKLIAQNLREKIKKEISDLKLKYNKVPGLAVVQVGNVAASSVYVKAKTKSAQEVGIEVIDHHLEEKTTEKELLLLNSHILSGFLPNIVYLPLIFPFSTDSKIKLFFSSKKLSIKFKIS